MDFHQLSDRQDIQPLRIDEVIQAGDIFLCRFRCPQCSTINLSDFRGLLCDRCAIDFTDRPVLKPSRNQLRLLAGTERKQKAGVGIKAIRAMYAQQEGACAYCACELEEQYDVEHIIPLSFGGTNNLSNLCLSCRNCNALAGDLVFQDFYQKQAYIMGQKLKRRRLQS